MILADKRLTPHGLLDQFTRSSLNDPMRNAADYRDRTGSRQDGIACQILVTRTAWQLAGYFQRRDAVVVLFAMILKIKDWLRPKGLMEDSPEELLLQFRDIHKQGELSADEYKNIRERLTKKSGQSDRAGDASSGPSAEDTAGSSPANDQ